MHILTKKINADTKAQVLAEYLNRSLKLTEIAKRHEIPLWKLNQWVRTSGVARRPRGARPLTEPSPRAQKILAYACAHGFSKAASYFNISKQLVSSLAKRWNIQPPTNSGASQPEETGGVAKSTEKRGKLTRDVVVSFRLRADELSSLRAMYPAKRAPQLKSHHKLVRAVVLTRLGNLRA